MKDLSTAGTLSEAQWPSRIAESAFIGLPGDFVKVIEPCTEADPVAILVQFLSAVGNAVGRCPHFIAEGDVHYLKLNPVLVGESSKARKGTSWGHVAKLLADADPRFMREHVTHGLSTGEGLVFRVRDQVVCKQPIKEHGRTIDFHEVISDEGVLDKRLLVVEPEFAKVLRVAGRAGNTLSALVRCAWDTGHLQVLTKNAPMTATGSHISIIGHTTAQELRRYMTATEMSNGFANRFLWFCVARSKILPEGGTLDKSVMMSLSTRLKEVLEAGRYIAEMKRSPAAKQLWAEIYPDLSRGTPRQYGFATSRSEAQVMRLAAVYAVLDQSVLIHPCHLNAALAVWNFAEASARWIFGESFGDPLTDQLLSALKSSEDGLSRSDIRDQLNRHGNKGEVDKALETLARAKLAYATIVRTQGRSREVWRWFGDSTRGGETS